MYMIWNFMYHMGSLQGCFLKIGYEDGYAFNLIIYMICFYLLKIFKIIS